MSLLGYLPDIFLMIIRWKLKLKLFSKDISAVQSIGPETLELNKSSRGLAPFDFLCGESNFHIDIYNFQIDFTEIPGIVVKRGTFHGSSFRFPSSF